MCSEHVSKVQGVSSRVKGLQLEAEVWCFKSVQNGYPRLSYSLVYYLLFRFSFPHSPPVALRLSPEQWEDE